MSVARGSITVLDLWPDRVNYSGGAAVALQVQVSNSGTEPVRLTLNATLHWLATAVHSTQLPVLAAQAEGSQASCTVKGLHPLH